MIAISIRRSSGRHALQRGFTLVELMIAILIGLFLVGGLLTLTGAMKRTGSIQSGLSLLHDEERMALSLMTDTIQSSGYFAFPIPLPTSPPTPSSTFLVTGVFTTAGQIISGTDAGAAATQTDTVSVRYTTAGGDGVINCLGATSAVAANWIAKFQIDTVGNNLQCVLTNVTTGVTAAPVNLVANVQYMQILYGVQTNTASGTYSVDTYLTATQVTNNSQWPNVMSVQVTLWFTNPLYCTTKCQAGQQTTQPSTVSVTRTIALMNKAGVNT
jgi:type IV pilus assembly protein PilW